MVRTGATAVTIPPALLPAADSPFPDAANRASTHTYVLKAQLT